MRLTTEEGVEDELYFQQSSSISVLPSPFLAYESYGSESGDHPHHSSSRIINRASRKAIITKRVLAGTSLLALGLIGIIFVSSLSSSNSASTTANTGAQQLKAHKDVLLDFSFSSGASLSSTNDPDSIINADDDSLSDDDVDKTIESDSVLIQMAKLAKQGHLKQKSPVAGSKDEQKALNLLGLSNDNASVDRLGRNVRESYNDGGLARREEEISRKLSEDEEKEEKQLEEKAKAAALKHADAVQKEVMKEMHPGTAKLARSSSSSFSSAAAHGGDDSIADKIFEDDQKRDGHNSLSSPSDDASAKKLLENQAKKNEKLIQAIKQDSNNVMKEVNGAFGPERDASMF